MKLTDFLQDVGRPVAYYPSLRRITGSTNATILLCQFIYWRGKESDPQGWLYKESEEIEAETGLSYDEQKTARKKLVEAGLLEEHYARLDHQMKFRLLLEALDESWGNGKTQIPEHGITALGKAESPVLLNESEITTENRDDSSSKHTAYSRGEQERPDKIAQYLNMIDFPGAKREAKIDAILSYLGITFKRNTSTKEWKEFAKYILSEKIEKDWDIETFVKWLFSKPDYKADFWSVKRMMEFYPQAFLDGDDFEPTRLL